MPRDESPQRDRRSPRRERHRPSHTRPRTDRKEKVTPRNTPEKARSRPRNSSPERRPHHQKHSKQSSASTTQRSSNTLSLDALAKLDKINAKSAAEVEEREIQEIRRERRQKAKDGVVAGRVVKDRGKHRRKSEHHQHHEKRRVVSGPLAEEGKVRRHYRGGGGYVDEKKSQKRRFGKKFWLIALVVLTVLVIVIAVVAVTVNKKKGGGSGAGGGSTSGGDPKNSNLQDADPNSVPATAKGGILDPWSWYDTADFNVTYTDEKVGGLPVIGLNSKWDDSKQANDNVPPLDKPWAYGTMPIRGVNVGGWLSIEPFITPSLFSQFKSSQGIIDEYTLTKQLGPEKAKTTLEKHYAQFINKQSFEDIQAAGFDHVRIPYSYWAVTTYPGDPYVPQVSWRYLLRGIEYARQCGLRVNLDLHALPGSQNGWNHSGRQGPIGWLNGTDGALNGQRSIDIHGQLATFFAQPRYKSVIAIYGLANEPKMIKLDTNAVLTWTTNAVDQVRKSGIKQTIAIGDGFLGLPKWQGKLQGVQGLVLDSHPYTIFNAEQIVFPHAKKITYACTDWQQQQTASMDTSTGFGPTLTGEWSQADTDCAPYLNNVGIGSRWLGTCSTCQPVPVLKPSCPSSSSSSSSSSGRCTCDPANASPSQYSSDYKSFLRTNAEAQMQTFEVGWGWFYWTWVTEEAVQWSWKGGMQAGILPPKVWERRYNCSAEVPGFGGLPENY